jgi:multidrug resistance efflux pump
MFETGAREQEIKQVDAMFERSKADAENAKTNYERQIALFERKAAAADAVDAARKTLEMSARLMEADRQKLDLVKAGFRDEEKALVKHELEEAEAASDMAERGPREQEIKQAKASVDAAEARVRRLEILRDEGTVKAPVRCVVEAFDLQPGDLIVPGAPLATLVRRDQLWVRAFIPETEIGRVHENQKVQIKVDSFPAERFEGAVIRVNRIAEFTPRNVQTFEERQDMLFGIKVRITDKRVTEPDGDFKDALRPGMAATVYVPK